MAFGRNYSSFRIVFYVILLGCEDVNGLLFSFLVNVNGLLLFTFCTNLIVVFLPSLLKWHLAALWLVRFLGT